VLFFLCSITKDRFPSTCGSKNLRIDVYCCLTLNECRSYPNSNSNPPLAPLENRFRYEGLPALLSDSSGG
jgi:hypothetical protein